MTKGMNGMKTRLAIVAAGLSLSAGISVAYPAAAQTYGAEVRGCVTDSEDAVQLGQFGSVPDAVAAARRASIPADDYGLATIVLQSPRRRLEWMVAIDAGGVVHRISKEPCMGSGRKMRPPQ